MDPTIIDATVATLMITAIISVAGYGVHLVLNSTDQQVDAWATALKASARWLVGR